MIDELRRVEPGPDLDVRIGVGVMGWHVAQDDGSGEIDHYPYLYHPPFTGGWMVDEGEEHGGPRPWHPSTDIRSAWEVFAHHSMSGQVLGGQVYPAPARPDLTDVDALGWAREWFCTARGEPIVAPTAPLAICRAALITKG